MRADSYADLLRVFEDNHDDRRRRLFDLVAQALTRRRRVSQEPGFHIVPINPTEKEILGEPAFPSLLDVDVPVDVVEEVFGLRPRPRGRPGCGCHRGRVPLATDGIVSEEAVEIAETQA